MRAPNIGDRGGLRQGGLLRFLKGVIDR